MPFIKWNLESSIVSIEVDKGMHSDFIRLDTDF